MNGDFESVGRGGEGCAYVELAVYRLAAYRGYRGLYADGTIRSRTDDKRDVESGSCRRDGSAGGRIDLDVINQVSCSNVRVSCARRKGKRYRAGT